MFWSIFFRIHLFKQSLILSGYFHVIFIRPTFPNICCPLFSKKSRFKKILLFFNSQLKIFWSRVQPGWKISVRPWESILRIKSLSTMIVMNWSNKNLSRFLLSTKFRSVYESNLKRQFQYFLASFFTPCLLINEEIIRLKKEEKISNYYKKEFIIAKVRNS